MVQDIGNLSYMDDAFWVSLLKLSDFGHFQLDESVTVDAGTDTEKQYGDILNSDKSIIFRLLRNYFVGVTESGKNRMSANLKITWTSEY